MEPLGDLSNRGRFLDLDSDIAEPVKRSAGRRIVICSSGFHGTAKVQLAAQAAALGAEYSGDLVAGRTTHLVCRRLLDAFGSAKYRMALQWGIHVVAHRWVTDSLAAGRPLSPDAYKDDGDEALAATPAPKGLQGTNWQQHGYHNQRQQQQQGRQQQQQQQQQRRLQAPREGYAAAGGSVGPLSDSDHIEVPDSQPSDSQPPFAPAPNFGANSQSLGGPSSQAFDSQPLFAPVIDTGVPATSGSVPGGADGGAAFSFPAAAGAGGQNETAPPEEDGSPQWGWGSGGGDGGLEESESLQVCAQKSAAPSPAATRTAPNSLECEEEQREEEEALAMGSPVSGGTLPPSPVSSLLLSERSAGGSSAPGSPTSGLIAGAQTTSPLLPGAKAAAGPLVGVWAASPLPPDAGVAPVPETQLDPWDLDTGGAVLSGEALSDPAFRYPLLGARGHSAGSSGADSSSSREGAQARLAQQRGEGRQQQQHKRLERERGAKGLDGPAVEEQGFLDESMRITPADEQSGSEATHCTKRGPANGGPSGTVAAGVPPRRAAQGGRRAVPLLETPGSDVLAASQPTPADSSNGLDGAVGAAAAAAKGGDAPIVKTAAVVPEEEEEEEEECLEDSDLDETDLRQLESHRRKSTAPGVAAGRLGAAAPPRRRRLRQVAAAAPVAPTPQAAASAARAGRSSAAAAAPCPEPSPSPWQPPAAASVGTAGATVPIRSACASSAPSSALLGGVTSDSGMPCARLFSPGAPAVDEGDCESSQRFGGAHSRGGASSMQRDVSEGSSGLRGGRDGGNAEPSSSCVSGSSCCDGGETSSGGRRLRLASGGGGKSVDADTLAAVRARQIELRDQQRQRRRQDTAAATQETAAGPEARQEAPAAGSCGVLTSGWGLAGAGDETGVDDETTATTSAATGPALTLVTVAPGDLAFGGAVTPSSCAGPRRASAVDCGGSRPRGGQGDGPLEAALRRLTLEATSRRHVARTAAFGASPPADAAAAADQCSGEAGSEAAHPQVKLEDIGEEAVTPEAALNACGGATGGGAALAALKTCYAARGGAEMERQVAARLAHLARVGEAEQAVPLKLLQRPARGSTARAWHGLPPGVGGRFRLQYAEQIQVPWACATFSTKERSNCAIVMLPGPLPPGGGAGSGGCAHASQLPEETGHGLAGSGGSDGRVTFVAEPVAFYQLPSGGWWMEGHRFLSARDLRAAAKARQQQQQQQQATLRLPADYAAEEELVRSAAIIHVPVDYIKGCMKLPKVRRGTAATTGASRARGGGGGGGPAGGGFFWRYAFDEATLSVVATATGGGAGAAGRAVTSEAGVA